MHQFRWKSTNKPLAAQAWQCRLTLLPDGSHKIEMRPASGKSAFAEVIAFDLPPPNQAPIAGDVIATQEIAP